MWHFFFQVSPAREPCSQEIGNTQCEFMFFFSKKSEIFIGPISIELFADAEVVLKREDSFIEAARWGE